MALFPNAILMLSFITFDVRCVRSQNYFGKSNLISRYCFSNNHTQLLPEMSLAYDYRAEQTDGHFERATPK